MPYGKGYKEQSNAPKSKNKKVRGSAFQATTQQMGGVGNIKRRPDAMGGSGGTNSGTVTPIPASAPSKVKPGAGRVDTAPKHLVSDPVKP